MSKKITTYEELLEEEARLEELATAQRSLVRDDFQILKEGFIPIGKTVSNAYSFVGRFAPRRRSASRLVNLGLDLGIEVFLKRILLANSGWVTRLVIPYFVRNFSPQIAHLFTASGQKDTDGLQKKTWWRRVKKKFSKEE